jgi:hypothetical protein
MRDLVLYITNFLGVPSLAQAISVTLGVLGYIITLILWHRVGSPDKFAAELSYWLESDMLKGSPKKLSTKFDRYRRFLKEVIWAARWSALSVSKHILFALGFGIFIFIWTAWVIYPYTESTLAPLTIEKITLTIRMLLIGLVDALTFGIFEVLGLDVKPNFPDVEARVFLYLFYVLTGIIVLRALVMALWEIWTVLVAIIFPEPMTRLANEHLNYKPVGSRLRKFLSWITTFGDDI